MQRRYGECKERLKKLILLEISEVGGAITTGVGGRVRAATVNVSRDSKKLFRLKRALQNLVPIEVPSEQEQADVNIVNKNNTAVNNLPDNADAGPRRNAALNTDILRRMRS